MGIFVSTNLRIKLLGHIFTVVNKYEIHDRFHIGVP